MKHKPLTTYLNSEFVAAANALRPKSAKHRIVAYVESYDDIYYVDNIMFTDGGENYLFVRPFEGYGKRAPLTENDRIVEALKELTQAVDNLSDNVMSTRGLLL
jgi:hypothetical protein